MTHSSTSTQLPRACARYQRERRARGGHGAAVRPARCRSARRVARRVGGPVRGPLHQVPALGRAFPPGPARRCCAARTSSRRAARRPSLMPPSPPRDRDCAAGLHRPQLRQVPGENAAGAAHYRLRLPQTLVAPAQAGKSPLSARAHARRFFSSACVAAFRSADPIHFAAVGKEHPAVQREPAQLTPPAQRAAVRRLLQRRGAGMCELVCVCLVRTTRRALAVSSVHLTMARHRADSATDCRTASSPAPWCDWRRRQPRSQTGRASCWPRLATAAPCWPSGEHARRRAAPRR
jgi:hypothetical protein